MRSKIAPMDINAPNVSTVENNNANLVPTVDLKCMETVTTTVSKIKKEYLDNFDITADDIKLENLTQNIDNNEINNTSNTNEDDVHGKFPSDTVLLDNDIKIMCVQNKSIGLSNLSDVSDDENTSNEQSIEIPNSIKSVSELQNISATDKQKQSTNSLMKPIMFERRAVNISKPHVSSTVTTLHNRKRKLEEDELFDNLNDNSGTIIFDKKLLKNPSFMLNQNAVKISKPHVSSTVTTSSTNRKLRPIIIDALNIGHAHGSGTFSVKGIEICIQFFIDRGHKDVVAIIPIHRQGPDGSESRAMLENLWNKGQVCFTPSRKIQNLRMTCQEDRIMLEYANKCGGVVVSNDNFRDLYDENEAFKEIIENRLVMVAFVKDDIIVPDDQYNRRPNTLFLSDILCFPE